MTSFKVMMALGLAAVAAAQECSPEGVRLCQLKYNVVGTSNCTAFTTLSGRAQCLVDSGCEAMLNSTGSTDLAELTVSPVFKALTSECELFNTRRDRYEDKEAKTTYGCEFDCPALLETTPSSDIEHIGDAWNGCNTTMAVDCVTGNVTGTWWVSESSVLPTCSNLPTLWQASLECYKAAKCPTDFYTTTLKETCTSEAARCAGERVNCETLVQEPVPPMSSGAIAGVVFIIIAVVFGGAVLGRKRVNAAKPPATPQEP